MKLRASAGLCILAATVAGGLWDLRPGAAQVASTAEPEPQPAATQFQAQPELPYPSPAVREIPVKAAQFYFHGRNDAANTIYGSSDNVIHFKAKAGKRQFTDALYKAAAALRDAKDDAAKASAQAQLTELLNKYFEEDVQRREEELAKLEERMKSLRALLERRREKKSEIVELQIKVLLNEADGLGFFNEAPASNSAYSPFGAIPTDLARVWNTTQEVDGALIPPRSPTTAPPANLPPK